MRKTGLLLCLVIAALIISSCREINVETIINRDGSFTRVITITGDSSDVIKMNLPYPVNDSWESHLVRDSADSTKFIQTYTRYYKNSEQLNDELNNDTSWWKQINRTIEVYEDRGFFYSYINYVETIEAANPFNLLDYHDYLSDNDMMWLTGKKIAMNSADSTLIDNAEKKAENYMKDSYTLEIMNILKSGIDELNNPAIHKSLVEEYRDSLIMKVDSWSFESLNDYVDYFSKITGYDEIKKIKRIKAGEIKEFDRGVQLLLDVYEMEEYTVTVISPGLLTNTNSVSIVGNRVEWHVNSMSFLFEDLTMKSESRIVNYWRFVFAGFVLLVLSVALLVKWR